LLKALVISQHHLSAQLGYLHASAAVPFLIQLNDGKLASVAPAINAHFA